MNKKPPVTPIFPRNRGPVLSERMSTNDYLKAAGHSLPNFGPIAEDAIRHEGTHNKAIVSELNCITIAQHIDTCPICSKLYDTDKTLYLLAIFGLLITCFLLVRRLLNF